ncbi:LptF/LptG family permease [Candidatus Pelagibacter sp.]|nr:LptF/LptG family permease [Candidatus Pelagibacter sp.]
MIFKKFFEDINNFFLILLLSFGLIVWVIQAVNFLDFVTEDGHGLIVYIKYTLLNLPKIFSKLVPVIFFVSIYFIINKYEDNNELKIFWFLGVTRIEIVNKMIKHSLIFTILLLTLTIFIVPMSQYKAREFIQSSNIDFFPSLIQEKKFIDTVDGLTIFIEEKNNDKYKNIFLKDDKNVNKRIIFAKNGELINNKSQRALVLNDGRIININQSNITEFNFKSTTFDLSEYITKSITDFKVQEKSTSSLIQCYWNFYILNNKLVYYDEKNCNEAAIKDIQTELYKRTIKPLYLILLSILSGYIFFTSKENISSKKYRSIIFCGGILLIVISELFNSFLTKNIYSLIFALIFPLLLCLILYLIFKKNSDQKII